jgi:hypothetical protein
LKSRDGVGLELLLHIEDEVEQPFFESVRFQAGCVSSICHNIAVPAKP